MAEKATNRTSANKKNEFIGIIAKVVGSLGFRILFYAALIMLFYYGSVVAYRFGYRIFARDPVEAAPGTDIVVVVTEEMSQSDVVTILQKKGLIKDSRAFKILLRLYTNSRYGIKPGEYTLNTSMSNIEMIGAMSGTLDADSSTEEEHLGLYDTDEMSLPGEESADGS